MKFFPLFFRNFTRGYFEVFFENCVNFLWKISIPFETYDFLELSFRNGIFKNWSISVGIELIVFLIGKILIVRHQILSLKIYGERFWCVILYKDTRCFFLVMHIQKIGIRSWLIIIISMGSNVYNAQWAIFVAPKITRKNTFLSTRYNDIFKKWACPRLNFLENVSIQWFR